jgi:GT2 family glycosyltransferase
MDVSIVIVSYNTRRLTADCIHSIYEKTKDVLFEIILIDNASSDGSAQMVRTDFPDVILIESGLNLGFGRANNLGAERASGKYLFFLNSDTILLNNAVKMFYDWCEKNQDAGIGAVGCPLLDRTGSIGSSYHDFPVFSMEIRLLAEQFLKRSSLIRKLVSKKPVKPECSIHPERQKVDYIVGADMFIPRSVSDEVGLFDTIFFMYYEETDLQLRMGERGFHRFIIGGPLIVHLEGGSPSVSNRKRIMIDDSKFKYFRKHERAVKVFLFKSFYVAYRRIEALVFREFSREENSEYFRFLSGV